MPLPWTSCRAGHAHQPLHLLDSKVKCESHADGEKTGWDGTFRPITYRSANKKSRQGIWDPHSNSKVNPYQLWGPCRTTTPSFWHSVSEIDTMAGASTLIVAAHWSLMHCMPFHHKGGSSRPLRSLVCPKQRWSVGTWPPLAVACGLGKGLHPALRHTCIRSQPHLWGSCTHLVGVLCRHTSY